MSRPYKLYRNVRIRRTDTTLYFVCGKVYELIQFFSCDFFVLARGRYIHLYIDKMFNYLSPAHFLSSENFLSLVGDPAHFFWYNIKRESTFEFSHQLFSRIQSHNNSKTNMKVRSKIEGLFSKGKIH